MVAGHAGLVGSALVRKLKANGYKNLVLVTRRELNLLNQIEVNRFFETQKIDYLFVAAARVGGIYANQTRPADFIYENIMIAANVIHAASQNGVKKLLYLGSSCIYPKEAPQPIVEEALLSGPLEPTNEGYAIAKIAGLKLCQHYSKQYGKCFISAMPTNLYGPNDNYDPFSSHVIPGLLRRFHEAKIQNRSEVIVWGTGRPRREFLFVDDLADALLLLMEEYEGPGVINVGSGTDVTISELAHLVKEVTGYKGKVIFDSSKPDGTMRKLLNIQKMEAMGWTPKVPLRVGLEMTYRWVLQNGIFTTAEQPADAVILADGSKKQVAL